MRQKRVKQYKKIIKKNLIKEHQNILFEELRAIRKSNLKTRIKIALWIVKGEK